MENLFKITYISILLNSLIQLIIIFRYYRPLLLEYFDNKKISWNSNFDRMILVSFILFFYLSLNVSKTLLGSLNDFNFTITYSIVLFLFTIVIFLFQKIGVAERNKYNSISYKEPESKTYNHLLNESQLKYLFNEFKKYEYIRFDFNENNFLNNFLQEKIKLSKKLSAVVLYHLYNNLKENINSDKDFNLKNFVPFFLSYKNEPFNYDSVKNGSQTEYSKEIENIERIFQQIPK